MFRYTWIQKLSCLQNAISYLINVNVKIRIINLYRSFRPPNNMSPDAFFIEQLEILKNAMFDNCYVLGDFNFKSFELEIPILYRIPRMSEA